MTQQAFHIGLPSGMPGYVRTFVDIDANPIQDRVALEIYGAPKYQARVCTMGLWGASQVGIIAFDLLRGDSLLDLGPRVIAHVERMRREGWAVDSVVDFSMFHSSTALALQGVPRLPSAFTWRRTTWLGVITPASWKLVRDVFVNSNMRRSFVRNLRAAEASLYVIPCGPHLELRQVQFTDLAWTYLAIPMRVIAYPSESWN